MSTLKSKASIAFMWDFLGKLAKNGLGLIVSVFLARLLEPSDFGLIAMGMVIVGMAETFTDMGLSGALIQRRKVLDIHYSSVFYFNIFVASFLTFLIYLSAPYVAKFYENDDLLPLVQVLSSTFLLNAMASIQRAILRKTLNYKLITQIELQSSLLSGILAVSLGFYGLGVWSLVMLILSRSFFFNIIIWYKSSWKPTFSFSIKALNHLWSFGFRMFLSNFLDNLFSRIDYLIIGKLVNPSTLGLFQRAKSLNFLVVKYSSRSLMSVLFPVLSSIQRDLQRYQNVVIKGLSILSFFVFLLLGSLYLVSHELILILFGEKWETSVEFFKLLALSGFAVPLSALLVNILSSRGNSKAFLKLEILKKIVMSLNFLVLYYIGITSYLYGLVVVGIISVSLNILFASKEINLSFLTFAKPIVIQGLLSAVIVFIINNLFIYLNLEIYLIFLLIIKLVLFVICYFSFNYFFKTESYRNVKVEILQKIINKLKKSK